MKFLNNLIRLIVFILWALVVYYSSKAMGFTYDPEGVELTRDILRVVMVVIIFGGAYFIWKFDFIKWKKKD